MLIDAHAHINSLSEFQKKELIVNSASDYLFIDVSIDSESALQSLCLSQENACIYTSLGFHPINGKKFSPDVVEKYKALIRNNRKIVAIGEVGLDYKAELESQEQQKLFLEFLKLSKDCGLPLIIHNRWHNDLILDILNENFSTYENIVFHCFSEDKEFLSKILEKNGYVSFSLNILRGKKKIIESLKMVPLERLLLETDSPYMRINGQCSSPLDIEKVYNHAAKEKNIPFPELCRVIRSNVENVFGIKTS